MPENFKEFIKTSHEAAVEATPIEISVLDVIEIIKLVIEYYKGDDKKKKEVLNILSEKYKKPAIIYAETFAKVSIENTLKQCEYKNLKDLGNEEFSSEVVSVTEKICKIIYDFYKKDTSKVDEADEVAFIEQLCNSGISSLGATVMSHMDLNPQMVNEVIQKGSQLPIEQATVSSMALAMFAYVALSEAYKLLRQAQDDAAVAHEYRLRVEEECNESIELIKNYRMEMNQMVSDYLTVRQETFIESFKAMDKAILDGDINGYIKANNSIQEILNYDIQFRNEDEFDALMNSDMDFKL